MGNQEEKKEESKASKEEIPILAKDPLSHFLLNIKENSYKMTQI